MTFAICYCRAAFGLTAPLVTIEAHISAGMPKFSMVGLPETAVKESKDRVRSAIINSGFHFPDERITVNLAPADLPKEGARFDLAIAIGILVATRQLLVSDLMHYEFAGELALSGELRAIPAILPFTKQCHQASRTLILPTDNVAEALLHKTAVILPAPHLLAVCAHLQQRQLLTPPAPLMITSSDTNEGKALDLSEVVGQEPAKRALTIAAAGGHSMLMVGPPGTGKSMLANRLPGLLTPLTDEQAFTVAEIYSVTQQTRPLSAWTLPPFRAPHHTASAPALVGGSNPPKPGEVSLAHQGVLFLDELPEFSRHVLETLREPLENGEILISRAGDQRRFPAKFQLIAAMNPCPCGYLTHPKQSCRCTPAQVQRYRQRLSQPLLDRIDLHLELPWVAATALYQARKITSVPTTAMVRQAVQLTQDRQYQRSGKLNQALTAEELQTVAVLADSEQTLLQHAIEQFNLSLRTIHRLLRVARTIADLDASPHVARQHLSEALSYRCKLDAAGFP